MEAKQVKQPQAVAARQVYDVPESPLMTGKSAIARLVQESVKKVFAVDVPTDELVQRMELAQPERGDIGLGMFALMKYVKGKKVTELAEQLFAEAKPRVAAAPEFQCIEAVRLEGAYLNFVFSVRHLGQVIDGILDKGFLNPLPSAGKDRVMIEYSQPNTHKVFHVGHMRNVALGDCLVRLFEQVGHPVVAANYFGDEGAHVAKCLWYLRKEYGSIKNVKVEEDKRGEFLGDCYSKGVAATDLTTLTSMPFLDVVAAEVLSIEPHPAADAPANWRKVTVKIGDAPNQKFTVICGGEGYQVGDKVAYAPLGSTMKKKKVEPKDFKGVESHGVMLAKHELNAEGGDEDAGDAAATASEDCEEEDKALEGKKGGKGGNKANDKKGGKGDKKKEESTKEESKEKPAAKGGDKKDGKKDGGKPQGGDKKDGGKPKAANQIYVLPENIVPGTLLTEFGRLDQQLPGPVDQVYKKRVAEVKETLLAMEHGEPELKHMWEETKQWSLAEFKRIYKWLGARFDHDFFESECGDESRNMVQEYYKKGVLTMSNGAIVADLSKYGLGFCVLLKSDGAGLYATKDLALARRKFDKFNIDRSIYVVDMAQTLHFKQVFKVLELFGYEKAKKCFHLPYGLVMIPSGKMSSRKGTVIYFSQLQHELSSYIYQNFISRYENEWPKEEQDEAIRKVSVGIIRYGMLNVDAQREIIFELDKWSSTKGNTGVYLLYAYTRVMAILNKAPTHPDAKVDYALLTSPIERAILLQLCQVWNVITQATNEYNPSALCNYLFALAQDFSSWYEKPEHNIARSQDIHAAASRSRLILALAQVIRKCLGLMGIETLNRL